MAKVSLKAEERNVGKAKDILEKGNLPVEVFGKGFENLHLQLNYQDFRRIFEKSGIAVIIDLEVDKKTIPVLIKDLQFNPISDNFIHVDFYVIREDQPIIVHVPIHLEGNSPAVKLGAILMHNREFVNIKCLPRNLISEIKVDISSLDTFGDHILIKDLDIPENILVLDEKEIVVVTISAPKNISLNEEETSVEDKKEEVKGKDTKKDTKKEEKKKK